MFWIMGLTGKGFGVPSQAVNITTGHQGDIFFLNLYHCCQSLYFLELVELNKLENLEDFLENARWKKWKVTSLPRFGKGEVEGLCWKIIPLKKLEKY